MTDASQLSEKRAFVGDSREQHYWDIYAADPTAKNREGLFRFYLPLVRRLVSKYMHLRATTSIEYDDLYQLACTGLLQSIDRFKPELGVPFRYFANRRINGAILNGIAVHSEVSQQISTRRRVAQERMASLRHGEGQTSTLDEALSVLGEIAAGLALGLILDESGVKRGEALDPTPDAFDTISWRQTVKLVRHSIDQLPPRDRDIMIWHYIEGLRFDQIGDLLGVTKGRISQLHKAAIALLRKRLLKAKHFRLEG